MRDLGEYQPYEVPKRAGMDGREESTFWNSSVILVQGEAIQIYVYIYPDRAHGVMGPPYSFSRDTLPSKGGFR